MDDDVSRSPVSLQCHIDGLVVAPLSTNLASDISHQGQMQPRILPYSLAPPVSRPTSGLQCSELTPILTTPAYEMEPGLVGNKAVPTVPCRPLQLQPVPSDQIARLYGTIAGSAHVPHVQNVPSFSFFRFVTDVYAKEQYRDLT